MPYMRLSDIYGPCTSGICRIMANHTQIHPGTKNTPTASNRATTGLTGSQLPTTLACGMATHNAQREIHRNLAGRAHNIQIGCDRGYVDEIIGPTKSWIMLDLIFVAAQALPASQKTAKALVSPTAQSMCRRCISGHPKKSWYNLKWKYQEILTEIWEYLGKCHIYLNLSTTI